MCDLHYPKAGIYNELLLYFTLTEGNCAAQARSDDLNGRSEKITDLQNMYKPREPHLMVQNSSCILVDAVWQSFYLSHYWYVQFLSHPCGVWEGTAVSQSA